VEILVNKEGKMDKQSVRWFLILTVILLVSAVAGGPIGCSYHESPPLNFSPTGWGGWSCPAGTMVVAGGYEPATHPILVSEAAKPGAPSGLYPVYPHYTFGPGETGWVVQNSNTSATLTIYVRCVKCPGQGCPGE
jgi:hypothetical protein